MSIQPKSKLAARVESPASPPSSGLDVAKYRVAESMDELAEGAPDVQVCILTDRNSYELAEAVIRREPEIERATGDTIYIMVSGDNRHTGDLYKSLRSRSLERVDEISSQAYCKKLVAGAGTRMNELAVNAANVRSIAEDIGVDPGKLPCIAWRTWPNADPTITTPIKKQWHADPDAIQRWVEAFIAWFKQGHYQRATRPGMTVGELRDVIRNLAPRLSRTLDLGVGCARPLRRVAKIAPIRAIINLESHDGAVLSSPTPASLRVCRDNQDPVSRPLTQSQFFYLTAFRYLGKNRRVDDKWWNIVDEQTIISRLLNWQKAELRTLEGDDKDEPQQRLSKEWPRFVRQMDDRIKDVEGWFEEQVWQSAEKKRYLRQSKGKVSLEINRKDRDWLRQMLYRLTGGA